MIEGEEMLEIRLANKDLGRKDAMSLACCLLYHKDKTKSIDLSGNSLTDIGVLYLCVALKTSKSVKDLNLKGNSLTEASLYYLLEMLKTNFNLTKLKIDDCQYKEIGSIPGTFTGTNTNLLSVVKRVLKKNATFIDVKKVFPFLLHFGLTFDIKVRHQL